MRDNGCYRAYCSLLFSGLAYVYKAWAGAIAAEFFGSAALQGKEGGRGWRQTDCLGFHLDGLHLVRREAAFLEEIAIYGRSPRAAKFGSVMDDGDDGE